MRLANTSLPALFFAFVIALCVCGGYACQPQEILLGTKAQATLARTTFEQGLSLVERRKNEVTRLLVRFRNTEPGQRLIPPAGQLPTPISRAQLEALYGRYTESINGQFDVLATNTASISVEYLNGINLDFSFFSFDAQQNVSAYRITFAANTRGIDTPALDEVSGYLSDARDDLPDYTLTENAFRRRLISQFGLSFTDTTGQRVTLGFNLLQTTSTAPQESLQTITFITDDELWDAKQPEGQRWQHTRLTEFTQTAQSGRYAVTHASASYSAITPNTSLQYHSDILLSTGAAAVIGTNGLIQYTAQSGKVIHQLAGKRYLVASIAGGPIECNLTTPSNTATGTTITMAWRDSSIENLLPGNNTCQSMIKLF